MSEVPSLFPDSVEHNGRLFRIRPLRAGDIPDIMRIEKESFPSPWSENIFRDEIDNLSGSSYSFGVEYEDRFIGYICFWRNPPELHITNIALDSGWKRKGLGTKLIEFAEKFAEESDCRWVTLEVRPSNRAAREMYEKRGFRYTGKCKNYYRDTGEDGLIMVKKL